jgi:Zn-dependent protease with chaperone function
MNLPPVYRHTQYSRLIWPLALVAVAITLVAALLAGAPVLIVAAAAPIALLIGWIFGSLTTTVTTETLSWWFGPGFWKKSVLLSEIEACEPVRNRWWWGWGIRYYGKGWLYNVSGLDAVEIRLAGGKYIRIGTNQPDRLAAAVCGGDIAAASADVGTGTRTG